MLIYPDIDPVLIQLGPIKVHWYGMMYLFGFACAWWLGQRRAARPDAPLTPEQVGDLVFYGALGAVLGGRLGYALFYQPGLYLGQPLQLLKVWEGGMSFHGGLLGVLAVAWWYARGRQMTFFGLTDFIAPLIPPGLGFGRIGNFINGELWGKPTDLPWGMVFPNGGPLPRHPSQLYEAALEGLLLFAALWLFSSHPRPAMAVSGLFLALYGAFRFLVEFFRTPDAHIGYLAFGWLTQGQLLTVPMFLAGLALLGVAYRKAGSLNKQAGE
jgi:phosphatidylglycerol:prolipoprotein diacylglycerol transferase